MANLDLSKFLGTWLLEGRTFDSPFTKDGDVRGRESFKWLGDQKFLVHELEGMIGDSPMACVDVTDMQGQMHAFYDDGSHRTFEVRAGDLGLSYANTVVAHGKTYQNRCIVRFLDDGTREGTWQCSTDGENWTTYWKSISKRINS